MHQTRQKVPPTPPHRTKTRRSTPQLGTDLSQIASQRITTGRSVAQGLRSSQHLVPTGPGTGSTSPH